VFKHHTDASLSSLYLCEIFAITKIHNTESDHNFFAMDLMTHEKSQHPRRFFAIDFIYQWRDCEQQFYFTREAVVPITQRIIFPFLS